MARQQQAQANQTFGTATANSTNYGDAATQIGGQLTPFLTQRLNNPQGYSQGDMGAMLANVLGSSGGATAGVTGQANLQAGRARNDAGFSGALDAAARDRTQAAAGASEGIAANNANLKQDQSNNAAKMLSGLYGTDVGAQDSALNTANQATQVGLDAGKSGWLQNAMGIANTAANVISAIKPGGMCWIAAELYGGWNDPRTIDIRKWIIEDFSKTMVGFVPCLLYRLVGERVAQAIRTHRWLRKPFRKIFDCALRKARA
jgi:hypothetical protein